MDGRTRLAVGGMATVAASVAVICTVALTNSAALSHSDGKVVTAAKVIVPLNAGSSGADSPPTSTPEAAGEPGPAPVAEVVPAPAPVVVAPATGVPSTGEPSTGTPQPPSRADVSDDDAIAEAERSGSWESVRQWAARWGWSGERVDAWISELERARDGRNDETSAGDEDRRASDSSQGPVSGEEETDDWSKWTGQWKKRPADAGANAANRPFWPGNGAKKDRSLVSLDLRDR